MKFASLKDPSYAVSLEQALSDGIPPDGSLYFPASIPILSDDDLEGLKNADQATVAKTLLSPWTSDEIPSDDLDKIIAKACSFETPLRRVGDKQILELFHGPTMAFKDVAARYLAGLMGYFNQKRGGTSTVLVATSGDTGGAIAHGFAGVTGTSVVVLFPKGRVSDLQRMQLTRTAGNVTSLEVDGSFDDCQSLVKQAFLDPLLIANNLTSANSISIGRLLPQMTYYGYIYGQLPQDNLRIVVPTGNLGNLTAGVLARSMGLPIRGFLAASNSNDAVNRYISQGDDTFVETIPTLATAMDVGLPNNLPRLKRIFGDDRTALAGVVQSDMIDDATIVETIKRVYAEHGYLLDPHTAVGWAASERLADVTMQDVIVATASPLKFSKEIEDATGLVIDNTAALEGLSNVPEKVEQIGKSYSEFQKYLLGRQ